MLIKLFWLIIISKAILKIAIIFLKKLKLLLSY